MTQGTTQEKDSQAAYEDTMTDAADKRTVDAKALADKSAAKAEGEALLDDHKDNKAAATKKLAGTNKMIQALHQECDYLLQYYETRKDARASELDSLDNAKAVLNGADYSFMQYSIVRDHTRALRGGLLLP